MLSWPAAVSLLGFDDIVQKCQCSTSPYAGGAHGPESFATCFDRRARRARPPATPGTPFQATNRTCGVDAERVESVGDDGAPLWARQASHFRCGSPRTPVPTLSSQYRLGRGEVPVDLSTTPCTRSSRAGSTHGKGLPVAGCGRIMTRGFILFYLNSSSRRWFCSPFPHCAATSQLPRPATRPVPVPSPNTTTARLLPGGLRRIQSTCGACHVEGFSIVAPGAALTRLGGMTGGKGVVYLLF